MAGPVIITRAEPGNSETANRIAEAGIPYICAPMLSIEPTGIALPSLDQVQGLLFTSANGVRAFCSGSIRRDLTAWCVGPATLAAAELAGFTKVQHADGNSEDLARLVVATARKDAGALLHVANEAAAGRLAGDLSQAGFEIMFASLYRAVPAEVLQFDVRDALMGKAPCAVLIHSAKGAAAFAKLTADIVCSTHIGVAVSEAAGKPLSSGQLGKVVWADRPNEAALLAALFRAYSTL